MPAHTNVTAFRATISVLGDGFVEAIADEALRDIQREQPSRDAGPADRVPVLEAPGRTGSGASAGRTSMPAWSRSPPTPTRTKWGSPARSIRWSRRRTAGPIDDYDSIPGEPLITDDEGVDVELFALFMRSTLAPPRDSSSRPPATRATAATSSTRLAARRVTRGGSSPPRPVRRQWRRLQGVERAGEQDHRARSAIS